MTWAIGFSNQIYPVGFCKIGLHKQVHRFFRSKNKNQKLGIRSNNKRPKADSYANPTPSFRFWFRSLKQISFVQIETGFLCEIGCGDGAPIICLFARVIQQLGF